MTDESDRQRLYNPKSMDCRLRPGTAAIDGRRVMHNPSMTVKGRRRSGRHELGQAPPEYEAGIVAGGALGVWTLSDSSWERPARKGVRGGTE